MTDLGILATLVFFVVFGLLRPSVAVVGYMWADLMRPNMFANGAVSNIPFSQILTCVLLLSIVLGFAKINSLKQDKSLTLLLLIFAGWICLTTNYSLYPYFAWRKWDWAIKTILLSTLIPICIKSRKELETIILGFLACVSYFLFCTGLKSVLGAGGYGSNFVRGSMNTGISESSTLSLVGVLVIPLCLFVYQNTTVLNRNISLKLYLYMYIALSLLTVFGSYARTGLVGLIVLVGTFLVQSKNKIILLIIAMSIVFCSFAIAPTSWKERMASIGDYSTDSSALGRIVVWKWTIDFANENILGGGFNCYHENGGLLDQYHDQSMAIFSGGSKAFHSIYFEVLGEHGYIGLSIYLAIIMRCYYLLRVVGRSTDPWASGLANSLKKALVVFLSCGMFVGIAFQPLLYLLVAFTASLVNVQLNHDSRK